MSRDKDNWTSERCFLGDAYPSFTNWVSRPDYKFSTGADGGYLYSGYPSPNAGLTFSESLIGQTENLEVTSTTYPSEERSELVRVEYTDVMPDDFNFSSETTPGGNNPEGGSSGSTTLLSSSYTLNNNLAKIVTDQTTAKNYAKQINAGTSQLVFTFKSLADRTNNQSWYISSGPSGTGSDGTIISTIKEDTPGYTDIQKGDTFTITVTLTASIKEKILENVDNSWWSGAMFSVQGMNISVETIVFIP
jgi:hypothetical protein